MWDKKTIYFICILLLTLLLVACGDENVNKSSENNDNLNGVENESASNQDSDDDVTVADEIAEKVLHAFMTIDYNTLYELGSESLREQLEEGSTVVEHFDVSDSPKMPNGVEMHKDYYGIKRYDTLYDEETGIYWYGINLLGYHIHGHGKINEIYTNPDFHIMDIMEIVEESAMSSATTHKYFGVKKNEETGDWIVSEVQDGLSQHKLISDGDADYAHDNATVLHQLPTLEEVIEKYGDDSNTGF